MPGIATLPFGPFVKGAVDAANPSVGLTGALKYARNSFFDGIGRLRARPGTIVALTFKDDAGSPADVTSVICLEPFNDQALAVAHSTVTSKFYLYRLDADMNGWWNAGGAHQTTLFPEPVAVLWTGAATPDVVFVAEGLGRAYIAHRNAGTSFRSKTYTLAGGLANLDADLHGAGVEQTYFRGLVSFQQHLWGWGYGSQAAADGSRPELLRFGLINYGTDGGGGFFAATDNFAVGHHIQSYHERVVGAIVSGQVLYAGTPSSLWPITGFGRSSWDKSRPLDDSYGFGGPKCGVSAGDTLYYWSQRGPMRVSGLSRPEPLWDAVAVASAGVVDPSAVVAGFDPDRDQVIFLYQNPTSLRVSVLAAFDVRRDCWLGPDGDIGIGVFCSGYVEPVTIDAPDGPPTGESTDTVGASVATAHLTAGDTSPGTTTIWEIKRQADTLWVVAAEIDASVLTYQFTGLDISTSYHWRAKHRKNGADSIYLGPSTGTSFITTNQLNPPTSFHLSHNNSTCQLTATWHNSGEAGVSTEIYVQMGVNPPMLIRTTAGPGVSSFTWVAGDTGTYYGRARHIKTGRTPSNYTGVDSETLTCSGGF